MFHLIALVFNTMSQLSIRRESMLTKLLMESLGGKSLALMIACVSPAASAVDETLSTLHYATCANNIVNAPSINLDSRDKVYFISPLLIHQWNAPFLYHCPIICKERHYVKGAE